MRKILKIVIGILIILILSPIIIIWDIVFLFLMHIILFFLWLYSNDLKEVTYRKSIKALYDFFFDFPETVELFQVLYRNLLK